MNFRRYRNLLGIDVCAKSQRKNTALIRAAENGHTACVRLLLDAGANKEASSFVREFRRVFSLQIFPMYSRFK